MLIEGSKGGRRMGGMEHSATGSRLLFAANEKRQTVAVCGVSALGLMVWFMVASAGRRCRTMDKVSTCRKVVSVGGLQ